MRPIREKSLPDRLRQGADVALLISVLAVVICVLAGVTACHGRNDHAPLANTAMPPQAEHRSMPAHAIAPVAASAASSRPGALEPAHAAQLAWPWRAAAEMAVWRMRGAPR